MVFGLRTQPLSAKSSALSLPLPSPIPNRARICVDGATHGGCLMGRKGLGPNRRYTRRCGQVLAFKTDSSLVQRDPGQTDSLTRGPGVVRYRFVVPQYVTTFGQSLRVVGSLPELGEWNPQHAPTMTWSDGHQWSLECALPQRSFEFKITVFEGHGVKWEGGSNRVVQAEGDEEGDVPVEIVVWLTCNFNATSSTQMQLAVPRASIQDAYETGKATLEFLKLRKSKLGQDTEQVSSTEERKRQSSELARLSEAVAEQSTVVHQLSDWLGHETVPGGRGGARKNGKLAASDAAKALDDDNQTLLLAIDSVRVPKPLRRISFVQSWKTGPAALPMAIDNGNANGASSEEAAAPGPSPFLRGELDSRAEDLISAAEVLLQELKTSSDSAPEASMEWASLAQEAGQVAVAMEALGAGDTASGQATQLQLRGLASVGNALAASTVQEEESPAGAAALAAEVEETPVLQALVVSTDVAGEADGVPLVGERSGDIQQLSRPGAEGGSLAGLEVLSADANSSEGNGVHGVASTADGGDGVAAASAEAGRGAEVAVQGVGRAPADGRTAPPQEVRGTEMHPLQRLAANVKDAVRLGDRPAAASAWTEAERQTPQPDGPPPQQQRAAAARGHLQKQQLLAPDDRHLTGAFGSTAAQATGSPHHQHQQEEAHEPQEPVPDRRRSWSPLLKFNVRAFFDSLFM